MTDFEYAFPRCFRQSVRSVTAGVNVVHLPGGGQGTCIVHCDAAVDTCRFHSPPSHITVHTSLRQFVVREKSLLSLSHLYLSLSLISPYLSLPPTHPHPWCVIWQDGVCSCDLAVPMWKSQGHCRLILMLNISTLRYTMTQDCATYSHSGTWWLRVECFEKLLGLFAHAHRRDIDR